MDEQINGWIDRQTRPFLYPLPTAFMVVCECGWGWWVEGHYSDVIMSTMASQITSLSIVCTTVCSGADQRKHQSSTSLAFVRGIHRWPVNSPHKWPVTWKMFPFDDFVMGGTKKARETGSTHLLEWRRLLPLSLVIIIKPAATATKASAASASFRRAIAIIATWKTTELIEAEWSIYASEN